MMRHSGNETERKKGPKDEKLVCEKATNGEANSMRKLPSAFVRVDPRLGRMQAPPKKGELGVLPCVVEPVIPPSVFGASREAVLKAEGGRFADKFAPLPKTLAPPNVLEQQEANPKTTGDGARQAEKDAPQEGSITLTEQEAGEVSFIGRKELTLSDRFDMMGRGIWVGLSPKDHELARQLFEGTERRGRRDGTTPTPPIGDFSLCGNSDQRGDVSREMESEHRIQIQGTLAPSAAVEEGGNEKRRHVSGGLTNGNERKVADEEKKAPQGFSGDQEPSEESLANDKDTKGGHTEERKNPSTATLIANDEKPVDSSSQGSGVVSTKEGQDKGQPDETRGELGKESAKGQGRREKPKGDEEAASSGQHKRSRHTPDPDSLEGQADIIRDLMMRKMGTDRVPLKHGKVNWNKMHFDVKNELYSQRKVGNKLDSLNVRGAPENGDISWEEIIGKPKKALE